ncbi:hypothetical protein J4E91_008144 [Alternaria rosae]|nr:hypothetical protein J4E91_008144 [Alternaria rosae]
MEADAVSSAEVSEVSVSFGILSLSDKVIIEQDGDYKIEDEKYLPFECKEVLGNGWSAVVQKVEHRQTKELFAKKVINFPHRPVYYWRSQAQAYVEQAGSHAPDTRPSQGSAIEPQMPEPAPRDVRTLQRFISGPPQTGWYDGLDVAYRMRTGQEAREFFKVGKVFAMLYTETASDISVQHPNDEAYTVIRFGQTAHTNIRRFVVVEVRRGFVNACASIGRRGKVLIRISGIGTYSGRGTLKDGCNPAEHTIVYFSGTDPASCYIPGEYETGMTKEPIEVLPAESSMSIRRESRIRFGKVYPIEMNVKVKDIGRVREDQIGALLSYWSQENRTPSLAFAL